MNQPATDSAVRTRTGTRLNADRLTLGYGDAAVIEELSLDIPDGAVTAILGPNGCGKSTLLRALVGLLKPRAGEVRIDGDDLRSLSARELARRVGFLPQGLAVPEGIRVQQLVRRGRYPHQPLWGGWTRADQDAVDAAIEAAGVDDLTDHRVDALSGGQRQRAWIAMVLAQETPYLLLDEPTTFLDIAHQIDLLRLLTQLRSDGRTVVAVLHDLNQAARYADHLVVMAAGRIVAAGAPAEVITADLVEQVFGLPSVIVPDPVSGSPMIVPRD